MPKFLLLICPSFYYSEPINCYFFFFFFATFFFAGFFFFAFFFANLITSFLLQNVITYNNNFSTTLASHFFIATNLPDKSAFVKSLAIQNILYANFFTFEILAFFSSLVRIGSQETIVFTDEVARQTLT